LVLLFWCGMSTYTFIFSCCFGAVMLVLDHIASSVSVSKFDVACFCCGMSASKIAFWVIVWLFLFLGPFANVVHTKFYNSVLVFTFVCYMYYVL
jgi:membrane protein implicated in regulation of membrane protease activity